MYETQGVIDKQMLYEFSKYTMGGRKKRLLLGVAAACLAYAIFCVLLGYYWLAALAFLGATVLVVNYYYVRRRMVALQLKRSSDIGADSLFVHTAFVEEGIQVLDPDGKATFTLCYDKLVLLRETSNAFLLITESGIYIVVFKEQLTGTQQGELIEFLRGRPTRIRWR